jgi:hypothetical protein
MVKVRLKFSSEENSRWFLRSLKTYEAKKNWQKIGPKEWEGKVTGFGFKTTYVTVWGLDIQASKRGGYNIGNLGLPIGMFSQVSVWKRNEWKVVYPTSTKKGESR